MTDVRPLGGAAEGGTPVEITGQGFDPLSVVRFGDTVAARTVVESPTRITAVSPAREQGTIDVTVEGVLGSSPDDGNARFDYAPSGGPRLRVNRLTPALGPTTGGTTVDIAGGGFCRGGRVLVTFGDRLSPKVEVASDTELTATVPEHPPAAVRVRVSVEGRRRSAGAGTFHFSGGPPLPTAAAPDHDEDGPVGRGRGWATCGPQRRGRPDCPGRMGAPRNLFPMVVLDPPACRRAEPPRGYPCGEVLAVAGAWGVAAHGTEALDSVERYDPSTGTWRPTAPVRVSRSEHNATLLDDGRILVAGGQGRSGGDDPPPILCECDATSRAELYDPVAETWAPTGSMSAARLSHTATLLDGPPCASDARPAWCGRVLVVGGALSENRSGLRSAEWFDPRTGTWAGVPDMAEGRVHHTATLMANGEVLVVGGVADNPYRDRLWRATLTAEIFDPATAGWRPAPAIAVARWAHTATRLADGRVLVVGGNEHAGTDGRLATYLASAEIYDPATDLWRPAGIPRAAHAAHTATLLRDGRVLVAGSGPPVGIGKAGPPVAAAEVYDPVSDRWEWAGGMHAARAGGAAVRLEGPACRARPAAAWCGGVLVAGGISTFDDAYGHLPEHTRRNGMESTLLRIAASAVPIATAELWTGPSLSPRSADSSTSRALPIPAWALAAALVVLASAAVGLRRRRSAGAVPPADGRYDRER